MRYVGVTKCPWIIELFIFFFITFKSWISHWAICSKNSSRFHPNYWRSLTSETRRFWNSFEILQKFHCHLILEQNSDLKESWISKNAIYLTLFHLLFFDLSSRNFVFGADGSRILLIENSFMFPLFFIPFIST